MSYSDPQVVSTLPAHDKSTVRVDRQVGTCVALGEVGLRHDGMRSCQLCDTSMRIDGHSCFAVTTSTWPQVSKTLRIVGPRNSHPLRKLTPRRLIDPDPQSESTLSCMREWMESCCKFHSDCAREDPTVPASRLISLGDTNDEICLVNASNKQVQYAALSHCWGEDHASLSQTTKGNMEDHFRNIRHEVLPSTFRDAMQITRGLGIHFIWIDSLCIIQHDLQDWKNEASKMGQIYSVASVTIIASRASSNSEGFLQPRLDETTEIIDFYNSDDEKLQIAVTSWDYKLDWTGDRFRAIRGFVAEDEPLSKRSWALQERYLSCRKLLFCKDQIFWECGAITAAEDGIDSKSGEFKIETLWNEQITNAYSYWYRMVDEYSSRDLTYESDVFPAFAGVAKRVRQLSGDEYMAGLWIQDISRGLSWLGRPTLRFRAGQGGYLEEDKPSQVYARRTAPYDGPSWSWASRRGGTNYAVALGRPDLENPWHRVDLLRYIAHNCVSAIAVDDIFNRPNNCWIKVETYLIPIDKVDDGPRWGPRDGFMLLLPSPTDTLIVVGYFDDDQEQPPTSVYLVPLAKTYQYAQWYLTFLIVQRQEGDTDEPIYIRVGMGHHWLCTASELGTSSPLFTQEKYDEYQDMIAKEREMYQNESRKTQSQVRTRTPFPDYFELLLQGEKTVITLI